MKEFHNISFKYYQVLENFENLIMSTLIKLIILNSPRGFYKNFKSFILASLFLKTKCKRQKSQLDGRKTVLASLYNMNFKNKDAKINDLKFL